MQWSRAVSRVSQVSRPRTRDVVPAGVVGVVVGVGIGRAAALQPDAPAHLDLWAYLLAAVAVMALAWWRAAPLAALVGSVAAASSYLLLGYPFGPIQLCMVLAMFAVAWRLPLACSLAACAIAAVISTASVAARLGDQTDSVALALTAWASWLIVPWCVGALLGVRSAAMQRTRRDLIAATVLTERIRLAADVHDAAGHGLAVISMQAQIARLVFDEQPAQAKKSLRAIEDTSRVALAQLRTTLHTLSLAGTGDRSSTETVEVTPVPLGVSEVPALVERVRHAGLATDLYIDDAVAAVPLTAAQQTAVYRVVQESLTNTLQHAGPARATVRIGCDRDIEANTDTLTVSVIDTEGSAAEAATDQPLGSGRGIAGMRARVEALGGEFSAQPGTPGGFAVRARIPLTKGRRA